MTESLSRWFSRDTMPLWQEHLPQFAPIQSYLEIGVFAGDSLKWVADNLLSKTGRAIGVDSYLPARRFDLAVARAKEAKEMAYQLCKHDRRIVIIESDSVDYLCKHLTTSGFLFDMLYVDGSHEARTAILDMCLGWRALAPGGVLIIDDLQLHAGKRRSAGVPKTREAHEAFRQVNFRDDATDMDVLFQTDRQIAYRKK